jgi:hypothetical protein
VGIICVHIIIHQYYNLFYPVVVVVVSSHKRGKQNRLLSEKPEKRPKESTFFLSTKTEYSKEWIEFMICIFSYLIWRIRMHGRPGKIKSRLLLIKLDWGRGNLIGWQLAFTIRPGDRIEKFMSFPNLIPFPPPFLSVAQLSSYSAWLEKSKRDRTHTNFGHANPFFYAERWETKKLNLQNE